MEKQNNSETNKNAGLNEANPPKKKMKVSTIVVIVLVVLLLFSCVGNMGGSGSSSSSTANSTTTVEEKEPEDKKEEAKVEEPEEVQEPEIADEANEDTEQKTDGNIYVGDTVEYTSCSLLVNDAGIAINEMGWAVLFIEIDFTNKLENEVNYLSFSDFSLYIDDYQVDINVGQRNADDLNLPATIEVNPGRKGKYVFRATLPSDYDGSSKIEVEFPLAAGIMLFKDNGVYLNGQKEAVAEDNYGDVGDVGNIYARDLTGNEYRKYIRGDYIVNLVPYDNGRGSEAMIYISSKNDAYEFVLYMEDDEFGGFSPEGKYDEAGIITFVPNGIEVSFYEHPEYDGVYE